MTSNATGCKYVKSRTYQRNNNDTGLYQNLKRLCFKGHLQEVKRQFTKENITNHISEKRFASVI
jgi:hypothetical protein